MKFGFNICKIENKLTPNMHEWHVSSIFSSALFASFSLRFKSLAVKIHNCLPERLLEHTLIWRFLEVVQFVFSSEFEYSYLYSFIVDIRNINLRFIIFETRPFLLMLIFEGNEFDSFEKIVDRNLHIISANLECKDIQKNLKCKSKMLRNKSAENMKWKRYTSPWNVNLRKCKSLEKSNCKNVNDFKKVDENMSILGNVNDRKIYCTKLNLTRK